MRLFCGNRLLPEAAEGGGAHILFSSEEASATIADILVAKDDFIKKEARTLEVFVRRWLVGGVPAATRDPHRLAQLLVAGVPEFGTRVGQVEVQLKSAARTGVGENIAMFAGQRPVFDRLFKRASDLWKELGAIDKDKPIDPSKARDSRFIQPLTKEWSQSHEPPTCDQYVSGPRLPIDSVWEGRLIPPTADLTEVERNVSEILDEHVGSWFCLFGGVTLSPDRIPDTKLSRDRAENLRNWLKQKMGMERVQTQGYSFDRGAAPEEWGCSSDSCPTVLRILRYGGGG